LGVPGGAGRQQEQPTMTQSIDHLLLCREVAREPIKGLLYLGVNAMTIYREPDETTISLLHQWHARAPLEHVCSVGIRGITLRRLIEGLQAAEVASNDDREPFHP
jgi:hypothetical protein